MAPTAGRPGEILSLQWRDVSLGRHELVFRAEKSKTRTERIVPISTRLLATLEMRKLDPAGEPFAKDAYVFGDELGRRVKSVRTAWENACDRAGLTGLQLRDLRHEAGSRFEEAGVPVTLVSKILGHTNLTTTSRYLNIHLEGFTQRWKSWKLTAPPLHSRCTKPTRTHKPLCPHPTLQRPPKTLACNELAGLRKRGFEPPRPCGHKLLRLARLPVPPLPHEGRRTIV